MKNYRKSKGKIAKKNKNILNQKSTRKLVYLIVGLLSVLFIVFIGAEGGYLSIVLGRMTAILIIIIIAYRLVSWTSTITEETEVWNEKKEFDTDRTLQVKEISTLLDRAAEGKTRSQEVLHEKIKDIFFIKLKEREGLSDKDLQDIVKKPERFQSIVQDERISNFILSLEEENDTEFDLEDLEEYQYKKRIRKIIQKISEWD